MEKFLIVDCSIMSLLILSYFIYANAKKVIKTDLLGKTLKVLSLSIIFLVLVEIIIHVLLGNPSFVEILKVLYILYYGCIGVNILMFSIYIYYFINGRSPNFKKIRIITILCIIYISVMLILNYFQGFIFTINKAAEHIPGKLSILGILLSIVFTMYILIYIMLKKTCVMSTSEKCVLAVLSLMMLGAAIGQMYLKNVVFIGPIYAYSLVTIYNIISNKVTTADALTGAVNRVTLNNMLDDLPKNKEFAIATVDMDNLKVINDTYGHSEGDFALTGLVTIINRVLKLPDIIARTGGDEFVVVFHTANKSIIEGKLSAIEEERLRFNEEVKKPYEIAFSISYEVNDSDIYESAHDVLKTSDNKMYEIKFRKKQRINIRQDY